METIKILILGIIQGLTEFLPVSSSGHLVIFQTIFGIKEQQLTLDAFLHFGTLIPILVIYWQDVKDIINFKKGTRRLTWLLIIGAIPTGLMGIFLNDFFSNLFSSIQVVGYMLLITGLLLFLVERISNYSKKIDDMHEGNALLIGIAQGIAIIPGISRSGSTIAASLFQGLDRESAARYSFLLSVPVIFGAGLLELKDVLTEGVGSLVWSSILIGVLAAAISGYFAIKSLLYILKNSRLRYFSYYCWVLGIIVIIIAGIL